MQTELERETHDDEKNTYNRQTGFLGQMREKRKIERERER